MMRIFDLLDGPQFTQFRKNKDKQSMGAKLLAKEADKQTTGRERQRKRKERQNYDI